MATEHLAPKDRIVLALDVADLDEARRLVDALGDSVGVFKIGLELIYRGGLGFAEELAGEGRNVFLDAKLLDIEATVERATAAIAKTGAKFLTVHATDRKTLNAAVRGRGDSAMKLLGVTVLTNLDRADLGEQGIDMPPLALVQERARLAQDAGFDGIVASGKEAAALHERLRDFLIVTPGIRPAGADANDQARIVTPSDAIAAGANYLVIGRPITRAKDPRAAAEAIAAEIAAAS
ncbi:orotidine-5'-phosphate decarboxylase [Methyloceanibacter caenitepidi]|uniref:Orotidine 5'-phosphate decarboxylase n=1 Tax=Methyloceanibacter caenitepidi TaxID=1384459 RepID=A0A0A8JZT5_9HYPH|nr:orotidine-5'-phosphate decarboxylase [Methyloceanibacter caenitepidi]BAQ15911.1 orotidine 5'-phosphate decarboxylase [Methyloceanibacter caenitepidi]